MNRNLILAIGAAITLAAVAIDAGPIGGDAHIARQIESLSRQLLDKSEMTAVSARLMRPPLRRRVLLSGPADAFQRGEIVRRIEALPGVQEARWIDDEGSGLFPLPLWIEAALMTLAGYAAGLTLAYLIELRRRARRFDRF